MERKIISYDFAFPLTFCNEEVDIFFASDTEAVVCPCEIVTEA